MVRQLIQDEVVAVFLNYTIRQIKKEEEIPNINFVFKEKDYEIFDKAIKRNLLYIPGVSKKDIDYLKKHSSDNCLSININNGELFFKNLTELINKTIELFNEYGDYFMLLESVEYLMRRIWLRMGINDIENVEQFLEKQVEFTSNRTLDNQKLKTIKTSDNHEIKMKTILNELWDETTRRMVFTITNGKEYYDLPTILYDIDNEGTCYIYGVQNEKGEKNKKIERTLYKLNKGIENPNVHPGKVYALLLFIEQLKEKNITNIKVPSLQILSYPYHEIISEGTKETYKKIKKEYEERPDAYNKNRYFGYKEWYDHAYNKQDKISYLKTEELINLFYRILEHDSDLEILNEVGIQGDSILLKINAKQKTKKQS